MTILDNPEQILTPQDAVQAVRYEMTQYMSNGEMLPKAWLREDEILQLISKVERRITNEESNRTHTGGHGTYSIANG